MAALAVLTAAFAACQSSGSLDDGTTFGGQDSGSDAPRVRSPASERVIGGIAELVLTDQLWPSFEDARANRITRVQDGSPLYAYIRSARPLGEIAHPPTPGGNYSFSEYAHLQIQIGDDESLRIANTCYVTMTPDEARRHEIVVPLAPLTSRPGQVPADCWLEAVTGSRSGPRNWEVRLAGFPGKFESWLPVPDLMSIAAVQTDFEYGAGEYATMLRATPLRSTAVVASAPASTVVAGSALVALDGGSSPSAPVPPRPAPGPAAAPAVPVPSATLVPARPAANPGAIVLPSRAEAAADSARTGAARFETARDVTAVVSSPIRTVDTDPGGLTLAFAAPVEPVMPPAPVRSPTLLPAAPPLPGPRQEIGNSRMELQLRSLSVAVLGRQPSDSYFTDRQWMGLDDGRGRVQVQQVHAAAVFRGETCSWQPLLATRRPGAQTLSDVAVAGEPIVVNCADLP